MGDDRPKEPERPTRTPADGIYRRYALRLYVRSPALFRGEERRRLEAAAVAPDASGAIGNETPSGRGREANAGSRVRPSDNGGIRPRARAMETRPRASLGLCC